MKWVDTDSTGVTPEQRLSLDVCLQSPCLDWLEGCTDTAPNCRWFRERGEPNGVYVRHLEERASVAARAVPVDDEDIGLPAAWALVCLTLVVAGLVFWLGGRWLGVL